MHIFAYGTILFWYFTEKLKADFFRKIFIHIYLKTEIPKIITTALFIIIHTGFFVLFTLENLKDFYARKRLHILFAP